MTEQAQHDGPAHDSDDPLVEAAVAETEFAAQTKAAVLRDAGIDAIVFAAERSWTGGVGISPARRGVPVWVRTSDLERAQAALKQVIADSVDIDWDEVDLGEPEGDASGPIGKSPGLKWLVTLGWGVGVVLALFTLLYVLFNSAGIIG
jgi:hypothetical protein